MEQTIASYLFLHNECSLPGIGTLKMATIPAEADYSKQEIKGPVQSISFIADAKTPSVANELLTASQLLKISLDNSGTAFLKSLGTFTRDKEGHIHFTPVSLDKAYTPTLSVPTLVHKKIVKENKPAERWWLWAAILILLATALIIVYCIKQGGNPSVPFGQGGSIDAPTPAQSYQTK